MSGASGSGRRGPVVPVWIGAILVVLLGGYLITADRSPGPDDAADGQAAPGGTPAAGTAAVQAPRGLDRTRPGPSQSIPDEAFVLAVLADTERVWAPILQATGSSYAAAGSRPVPRRCPLGLRFPGSATGPVLLRRRTRGVPGPRLPG